MFITNSRMLHLRQPIQLLRLGHLINVVDYNCFA